MTAQYCPTCKTVCVIIEGKAYCFSCCSNVTTVSKEYFDSPEYKAHEAMLNTCRKVKSSSMKDLIEFAQSEQIRRLKENGDT